VSFEIEGQDLALVGEAGPANRPSPRCIVGLARTLTEGHVDGGRDRNRDEAENARRCAAHPDDLSGSLASLNPRWRVRDIIAEPMASG
jgi:ABC-type dipeptide/oligopeptide/nickel transport system ATPase subunit